jgi:hypothetical protein
MKKKIVPLLLLFLFPIRAFSLAPYSIYPENTAYQIQTKVNRLYHHVDFRFSPRLIRHFGASYRAEYSMGGRAIDLQGSFLLSSWNALSVPPSADDLSADEDSLISDPSTEVGAPRSGSDRWTQWILEAGYSYRGRLVLPIEAKRWTQAARFALGYTGLSDGVNDKRYSGPSINFEISVYYALSQKVLFGPKISYRHGWVHLNGTPTSNLTRVPISTLDMALGLVF